MAVSLAVRVIDIGPGGALLASSRPFAVGQRFALRLPLRQRMCVARGIVARVKRQEGKNEGWLIGVPFQEWDGTGREDLLEYLRSRRRWEGATS